MTAKSFKIQLARDVHLDARTLVDTRMLVAGSSGSGKSYCMRLIAEQAAPKLQTIILDPEGEYTTLREKVDLLIVSREGEVVPTIQTAAKLARTLLELQVSAVIDLYDLKIQDRRTYVRRFLDSLMNVPKKLWRPCLIMLDEAHKFCPERSSGQAESTDAVITLLSQGRKRGFCSILSTQRLQKLHKDAAAETLNNLIGRTSLDTDVRRARDILGLSKADEGKLRALKPGNWFGFGPAFVDLDGICQFKAQRATTTHPEPGNRHTLRPPAPSARIKKVLPALAELPQQVEQEAKDLAGLQLRVRELQRELAKARSPKATAGDIAIRVDKAVERAADKTRREASRLASLEANALGKALRTQCAEQIATFHVRIAEALETLAILASSRASGSDPGRPAILPTPDVVTRSADPMLEPSPSRNGIGGGKRRIMIALASCGGASRTDAAIMASMTPSSGTYSTYLSALKKDGYVADSNGILVLTELGVAALGDYEPTPIGGPDLIQHWRPQVGGGGLRRLFDALADAGVAGLERPALAHAAELEPSSGTLSTYLAKLRKKGLIVGRKPFKLADVFLQ